MKKIGFITIIGALMVACMGLYVFQYTTHLGDRTVGVQPDGSILVPSNQLLRPAGFQVYLPGRPVDLALSADGHLLFVKNMGSLDIIRIEDRTILQSLPYPGSSKASYTGLCLSADDSLVYVTDITAHVQIARLGPDGVLRWIRSINLPKPAAGGQPNPSGLALDSLNDRLYVTLNRSNTLCRVNLKDTGDMKQIPVGMAPYDIIMAGQDKAYVSNWGGRLPKSGEMTYSSGGSQVLVDPHTGVANSGTISVVDLKAGKTVKSIPVGLHPSGMVLSPDKKILYVACANSDIISVIDTRTDQVTGRISVHAQKDIPFGSAPNALDISPDGKRLYVANGTENAITIIRTAAPYEVLGHIPTGWYPGAVLLDHKMGFLYVANVKGVGSLNQRTTRRGHNSHDVLGTVSLIPVPGDRDLKKMTAIVRENNSYDYMMKQLRPEEKKLGRVPVPWLPGQTSRFKHVIYIIKENRTYDQLLGDMTQGNGDSSLVQFGRENTPNHHLLAETFVLMDNFNCSGILSATGHQWTDEAYVTDYLEKAFGGFVRSYPFDGGDPLAYASSGFIWDNVLRHGLTFRDYGEFVRTEIKPKRADNFSALFQDYVSGLGHIQIRAKATLDQLTPFICPDYPGFTLQITDQYRASVFIRDLKAFEKNNPMPNFIILDLPDDHTSGTSPGLPTPQAALADNDLALGRIVEAVSHSKFWKETCIFVTEDDPQAGLDHVDGHRTVGYVISPYTKRGKVVSNYYSQINMVRTIENILGIPPMNQLDLTAEPMLACFTDKPDFSPYTAVPNRIPLDRVNVALRALKGKQLYWAQQSLKQNLDEEDKVNDDVFNRIIWHAVKGYDVPYPVLAGR